MVFSRRTSNCCTNSRYRKHEIFFPGMEESACYCVQTSNFSWVSFENALACYRDPNQNPEKIPRDFWYFEVSLWNFRGILGIFFSGLGGGIVVHAWNYSTWKLRAWPSRVSVAGCGFDSSNLPDATVDSERKTHMIVSKDFLSYLWVRLNYSISK